VPGHEGTDGNEMTDQLAKLGFERPFIGPEPACSISMGVAKKVVRDWTISHLKKRPYQTGIGKWSQFQKVPRERRITHTHPM
jgi:hypothetical protein